MIVRRIEGLHGADGAYPPPAEAAASSGGDGGASG